MAEVATVRNPKFNKDITVKPEFLPQPISQSSIENNSSLSSPLDPNSLNSSHILKSNSKKVSHKKTSRKSQLKKSSSYNGLSSVEDASIKDGNIRDSLNEVASLFSTPTFQQDLPAIQQSVVNASVDQATKPIPTLIKSKDENKIGFKNVPTFEVLNSTSACLGQYIAKRLVEVGVTDIFTVPGDFNLILLDHLIAQPGLNNIGCCNEINAGYAADGYARCRGIGACVVTFTVGGLSVINAIAGLYSENLPIICIVGGPNSNDYRINRILHHTIGISNFSQEARCFEQVTCYQVSDFDYDLITSSIS